MSGCSHIGGFSHCSECCDEESKVTFTRMTAAEVMRDCNNISLNSCQRELDAAYARITTAEAENARLQGVMITSNEQEFLDWCAKGGYQWNLSTCSPHDSWTTHHYVVWAYDKDGADWEAEGSTPSEARAKMMEDRMSGL